jgi:hypothetical protein
MKSKAHQHEIRVLAIGMLDSVHFARWLESVRGLPVEFTIFPSGPNRKVHSLIKRLLADNPQQFFLGGVLATFSLPVWIINRVLMGRIRAFFIWCLLRTRAYEVVHFHEMQSGSYPLVHLPARSLAKSKVIFTPYGSGLFWFQNKPKHLHRIRSTLMITDGMFPECGRDIELARLFGFKGEVFSIMPAAGPAQMARKNLDSIGARSKITGKGYGGTWGRAVDVLRSLEKIQDNLLGFEIHLTSATRDVIREVRLLHRSSNLRLVLHPKFALTPKVVMSLLAE